MSVKLSDLPKSVQDRVLEQSSVPVKRKRQAKGPGAETFRGRCHQCGLVFDGTRGRSDWQRHSDESQHRRFDCDLSPRAVP